MVAVDYVHNLTGSGIDTDRIEYEVTANVFFGTFADDIFASRVQAAYSLYAIGIFIGSIHKAFFIHIDTGELGGDEQLLLGALFLGRDLSPESFPQTDLYADGTEETGEIAFG